MTETVDKQKGVSLDRKEGQLVTCGIFYCRDSAEINGCGSLQTSSRFDSDVLRRRQQNIPLSVINKPFADIKENFIFDN
jgi:hypothetical protein